MDMVGTRSFLICCGEGRGISRQWKYRAPAVNQYATEDGRQALDPAAL
jgi:hypothetical protein